MPEEQATIWTPAALPGLTVFRASYHRQRFARHTHDFYVVGVNESGAHGFFCRGATWLSASGSIGIIHPGEAHTGERAGDKPWEYRAFYVSPSVMHELARDAASVRHACLFFAEPVIEDRSIASALLGAHAAFGNGDSIVGESRLIGALGELVTRHGRGAPPTWTPTPTRARRAVAQAREFLHDSFDQPVSLRELSALTGVSRYHLLREFEAETGLPPHTYMLQLRIERAKKLLASGRAIARVAHDVGFADQSHMNRHFKRFVGVTPGVYARHTRPG